MCLLERRVVIDAIHGSANCHGVQEWVAEVIVRKICFYEAMCQLFRWQSVVFGFPLIHSQAEGSRRKLQRVLSGMSVNINGYTSRQQACENDTASRSKEKSIAASARREERHLICDVAVAAGGCQAVAARLVISLSLCAVASLGRRCKGTVDRLEVTNSALELLDMTPGIDMLFDPLSVHAAGLGPLAGPALWPAALVTARLAAVTPVAGLELRKIDVHAIHVMLCEGRYGDGQLAVELVVNLLR